MVKDFRERKKKRKIVNFIRQEAKEYACVCGWTGMRPKKYHSTSEIDTKVTLVCEQCNEERTVVMDLPDEIIYLDL